MFVIFGWGFQTTKDFGVEEDNYLCHICHNSVQRHLLRVRTWFSLFFIPLIPYSTKYLCLCPICEKGLELSSSEFKEIKAGGEPKKLSQPKLLNSAEEYQPIQSQEIRESTSIIREAQVRRDTIQRQRRQPTVAVCSYCGCDVPYRYNPIIIEIVVCPYCRYKGHIKYIGGKAILEW